MSLWVDKYRPNSLSKLDYHEHLAVHLKKLAHSKDFPHLMFYGPSGAGKKTRIMCVLRELYGSGVEKLKIEQQTFTTPSKKKIDISTIASNYHIEVNPSDAGIYDRVVIQDLIKTVAQSHQLDSVSQKEFKGFSRSSRSIGCLISSGDVVGAESFFSEIKSRAALFVIDEVVILTEVDRLTKDAQHALRRTMEKYTSTCRLILYCNSTSKVIPAIRSRCLGIRVPAPSHEEICKILQYVCKKESLVLPPELAQRISERSGRNLRRALLICEACKVQQYPFSADQAIQEADWEVYLRETAQSIVEMQSPKRLLEVRGKLYELLTHCIPADVIIKGLLQELVTNCDGSLKAEVSHMAAFYEHRLQRGNKVIYHLEAFVAKFMSIYKKFLEEGMTDFF